MPSSLEREVAQDDRNEHPVKRILMSKASVRYT